MKVYRNISEFKGANNVVLTSGTFDGVHKGHKKVIQQVIEEAKKINGESVILTFFPHPRMVLQPNHDLKLLNTIEEKIELLTAIGIDHLIIHPFSIEFANISSEHFIKNIICKTLNTKILVIGHDHQFGKNREGSFEYLKKNESEFGLKVKEIKAFDINNINISSTKIRNAIIDGDMVTANNYLGQNFTISGLVVNGQKLGSTINFPTANIHPFESYKIIPKNGVYAVYTYINNIKYAGMLNVGTKPTVSNSMKTSIEVHIFDLCKDLYNQKLTISFVEKMRNEQKFNSIKELQDQLYKDKINATSILCD